MTRQYSLERDLSELEAMVERLGDYVLGDKLFLPLTVSYARRSVTPQLSMGAMLLRRRRLGCLRESLRSTQLSRLNAALDQHDALQREWSLHYEKKLKAELPARIRQMGAFFRDCKESPAACAATYPAEALRRTLMQEILLALAEFGYASGETRAKVEPVDVALRRLLRPGNFIWASSLEAVYPKREFWWLHGSPA